jgi:hypothetical protein
MLPLLREAPAAGIVNGVERRRLADGEPGPRLPVATELRPCLPCVQGGSQRYDTGHGDRTGVNRDQGQRRLPGLHQYEPQLV